MRSALAARVDLFPGNLEDPVPDIRRLAQFEEFLVEFHRRLLPRRDRIRFRTGTWRSFTFVCLALVFAPVILAFFIVGYAMLTGGKQTRSARRSNPMPNLFSGLGWLSPFRAWPRDYRPEDVAEGRLRPQPPSDE